VTYVPSSFADTAFLTCAHCPPPVTDTTSISIMFRGFHSWPRLPTELKVLVLEHALQDDVKSLRTTPLYHEWYMQRYPPWIYSWHIGRINSIISTRNREIVDLALDICEYPRRFSLSSFKVTNLLNQTTA
jgi:hypothetical protein